MEYQDTQKGIICTHTYMNGLWQYVAHGKWNQEPHISRSALTDCVIISTTSVHGGGL